MRKYKKLYTLFVLFGILFAVIACNLPFKIVPNFTPTPAIEVSDTLLPSTITQNPIETILVTKTPHDQALVLDTSPTIGSVLMWMDFSNFVFIPPGEFNIGKGTGDQTDYSPLHQVKLDAFWIQQSEVTNLQYAQCVADGRCSAPIQDPEVPFWFANPFDGNHPVVELSWFQARDYCSYIHARLPTEAEWEAAARGSEGKLNPWGGDKPNCSYMNFNGCLEPPKPQAILSYTYGRRDFFVYDLAGNVAEWVED